MTDDNLYRMYRLDGIVTTVDAEHGLGQLTREVEPARQIAMADRIVLTKTDRALDTSELRARITALNPAAAILVAVKGALDPLKLIGLGAHEIRPDAPTIEAWVSADSYRDASPQRGPAGDHHHEHDHPHDCAGCDHPDHHHGHDHAHGHLHGIRSFAMTFDTPLPARQLEFCIELLRSTHGEKLLRVKGILDIIGQEKPFVVHGVQHVFYPPEQLERWPGEDRRSRLVFITRDLDEATVRTVLAPLAADTKAKAPT
jgi:G3E family GTPase